jgi:hypothetical protein
LVYTSQTVIKAREELATIDRRLEVARMEADSLKEALMQVEEKLRESSNFVTHVYQLDWTASKMLASRYPRQTDLLMHILELRDAGIGWKLGRASLDEGFDSPSFAAFLLREHRLSDIPLDERYRLRELIPRIDEPRVGDLVFYEAGYAMFFFRDEDRHPFVLGMTPVGIAALEVEFGPHIVGYGRIDY